MKNTAKLLCKTALVLSMAFGAAQGSDLTLGEVAKIVKNKKANQGIDEEKLFEIGISEFDDIYNHSSEDRKACFEKTILNEDLDQSGLHIDRYDGYLVGMVAQYNDKATAGNAERYEQIPFKKIVSKHLEGLCPSDIGATKTGQALAYNRY